jgi:membrane protein insertase Oxa1/YidC/SpoIIIJ
MSEDRYTKLDRMRFTKNIQSSRLALLAIVFDVLFFVSVYKSDVDTYYYTILIGASIIYNLVFLLATFLASEGVKNYKPSYSWLLLVLGVIQIVRIFILPINAHSTMINGAPVMGDAQFIRLVIYLAASAVCLFLSAYFNLQKSRALAAHVASLQGQQA